MSKEADMTRKDIVRIDANNRMNLEIGTVLEKEGKKFLLIGWDVIEAGHVKEYRLIRVHKNWKPIFQFVKDVYDKEINEYCICKEKERPENIEEYSYEKSLKETREFLFKKDRSLLSNLNYWMRKMEKEAKEHYEKKEQVEDTIQQVIHGVSGFHKLKLARMLKTVIREMESGRERVN